MANNTPAQPASPRKKVEDEPQKPLHPNLSDKGGRRRAPSILQMEATECGAASLSMVLAHYGRFVPLEELRVSCGISRDGSKARNVLRAARSYGMIARGYRREPQRLYDLPFPMILFWNFNHFLVLEGIKGNKVYLNDPASGPRTISVAEFDQSFTGVCLAFQPDETFKTGGSRPNVYRGLWQRLGVSRLAFSFVVLATLALVIPGLVVPVFTKIFIDDILIRGSGDWIYPLIIGMIMTAIIDGALTWLQQYFLARLEIKLSITSSTKFFWHLLSLPMEFFNQRYVGDLNSRMSSNDSVAQIITSGLSTNIINLVTVFFFGIVLFMYDVPLAAVAVFLALCNFIFLRMVARVREDSSQRLMKEAGKIAGASVNGVHMIETLRASGLEDDFFSKWSGYQANALVAQHQLSLFSQLLNIVPPTLSTLSTLFILGLGSMRILDGALTIGGLVAFQGLVGSFNGPISGIVALGGGLQQIKADIARLDDVLNYKKDQRVIHGRELPEGKEHTAAKLSGEINVENIVFGYNRLDVPLIEDLSLNVQPGKRVALVGGSGSGKSTIARMIAGLIIPWEGKIHFDGQGLDDIPLQVFSNSLAFVDQDIILFSGTIRDNVTLWDETIAERNLTKALRDACIHDVVNSRAQKYDAEIEENGRNFSGGQRQRLEIARALSGNPSILILDEATAALDPIVEKEIDDYVRKRGCTCLIVAHRVSTIRDADEIIVLEKGQIVQRGIHEDMVAKEGPYRELILAH